MTEKPENLPGIAVHDADYLNNYQLKHHRWTDEETAEWNEQRLEKQQSVNPPFDSPYYKKTKKVIRAPIYIQALPSTKSNDESYVYKVQMSFDRLMSVTVKQELPRIRVKKEYLDKVEVKWIDNLLFAILAQCSVHYGTVYTQTLLRQALEIHRHSKIKNNYALYDYLIGNRRELTSWTSELPPVDDLMTTLPFPFCDDPEDHSKAIPLNFLRMTKQHVEIKIVPILSFSKLLCIRRKEGEGWRQIESITDELIKTYLTCERRIELVEGNFETKVIKRLPVPKMDAEYGKFGEVVSADDIKTPCTIYVLEYLIDKLPNRRSGEIITYPIRTRTTAKSTIILAENTKAVTLYNDYCNYTTSLEKLEGSWPITHFELTYGENKRIEKTDAVTESHRNGLKYHYINNPQESGYLMINYSYHPTSSNADTTMSFSQEQHSDLILYFSPSTEPITYQVYIINHISKRLTFSLDETNPLVVDS